MGKFDNPLHIALFPPYDANKNAYLDFSFMLNASLDIFEARTRDRNRVDQDLGMLQAIDERLSIWGWQTGTGTKLAVIVDSWGKSGERASMTDSGMRASKGVTDGDMRVAFRALQTAYVRLLQNPFYVPDEHTPMAVASGKGKGGQITSKRFIQEVNRIGENWKPGISAL
ncbi:hypothetical protein ACLMJK_007316 [Lecanora helva]